MLSITQFEVYVLDHGRWTIHARYGSDQRKAAVMDARTTEFTTGLPTKVVVETYFPEIDESELVTAYISPKARELREAAKSVKRAGRNPMTARPAAVIAPTTNSAKKRRLSMRPGISVRQFILQGIVAGAFSLVAATVSTVLISWGLKRSMEAGLPVSTAISTQILTCAYALFFLFFFMSLFRSKLPLHRMLSYLWSQSAATAEMPEQITKSIVAAIAPKLRPKRAAATVEAEAALAQEELKALRGDPAPEPEPEILLAPPPVVEVLPPPEPPPPPETASERRKREKKERKEAEERAKAAKAEAAAQAAKNAAAAAAALAAEQALPPAPPPLPLERAVLRRFVTDVVKPATVGTMPDDPVTRRGISLVIAGAAAVLAEAARTSYQVRLQLIEEALTDLGVNVGSVAMFIHRHDELIAAPANAPLVNLGRTALSKHLEGADVLRVLASAIAGWRTPFGQPTGQMPASETSEPVTAPEASGQDIYVLTELRMGGPFAMTSEGVPDTAAEAARDAAMGLHNSVVRSVLGTHGGHEVKHTGTGIFAQFKEAATALAAASEIQRRFTATWGPKLAVAVIATTSMEDDPLLTPNAVRQAQTVAAQACDGEILAERRVQNAANVVSEAGEPDDDETTLVKIPAYPDAAESALYEHEPVGEFAAPLAAPIPIPTAVPQPVNAP